jgi:hypothetical protein
VSLIVNYELFPVAYKRQLAERPFLPHKFDEMMHLHNTSPTAAIRPESFEIFAIHAPS